MKHLYRNYNEQFELVEAIENIAMRHTQITEGKVGKEKAEELYDEGEVDNEIRDCKLKWLYDEPLRMALMNIFHESNSLSFGFDISYNPTIQYTIYEGNNSEKGNYYDWHCDSQSFSETMVDRKLSMVILLSDPHEYEGGEFELSDNNQIDKDGKVKIIPLPEFKKKGDILIFPSFLNHRVKPVTSGIRKTLVSWAEGPKFR